MSNNRVLLCLFCCCFSFALSAAPSRIDFTPNDLASVKAKAKAKNRPYFAYFTASWCMPCRLMDENTWVNPEVEQYIANNYYAAKIDVDNLDGITYKQQLKVEVYPTIILFGPNGEFLKRIEGGQTASALLATLKAYDYYEDKANNYYTPPPPVVETTPAAPPPITNPSPAPPPIQKFQPTATGSGLYRFTVSEQASEGYSVQVGVYADYENVLREVSKFQLLFSEPILVHIDKLKDKTVYRVMIGDFKKIEKAAKYRTKIEVKGIPAFVKDLTTLK